MNDKEWQAVINKCRGTFDKYRELLKQAEDEYVRRYGTHPSDWDDDWWIDTMHYGMGDSDIKGIIDSAEIHKNRKPET